MSVYDAEKPSEESEVQREFCVRDLMTQEVATFQADDELVLAGDLMQLGRIRHIPIVAADGQTVIGILSQRDLFRSALARALTDGDHRGESAPETLVVGDIMNTDVKTVPLDLPLVNAARIMSEEKIGCLPVVDTGGKGLVGIITESDFVRHAGEQ